MGLLSLEVAHFRCIEHARLEFDSRCTAIIGDNAAGKTSVLEAIHVLSSGRSFRTSKTELLVSETSGEHFLLTGRVERNESRATLGVKWSRAGKEIRLNGAPCSGFAEIAPFLPTQVIDPSSHKLLEGGPAQRRRFLDWGVFHVEPTFLVSWRTYQKALAQRNAALRAGSGAELVRAWDSELVRSGESVAALRRKYLDDLLPIIHRYCEELAQIDVDVSLKHGWDGPGALEASLRGSWGKDVKFRTTTVGPHRADFEVRFADGIAKDRVSRGQQKLIACALILAQIQHRNQSGPDIASLLLDDPAAELDVNNLGKLLRLINTIPAQLIVSAVDVKSVESIVPAKMFHVKQGALSRVL